MLAEMQALMRTFSSQNQNPPFERLFANAPVNKEEGRANFCTVHDRREVDDLVKLVIVRPVAPDLGEEMVFFMEGRRAPSRRVLVVESPALAARRIPFCSSLGQLRILLALSSSFLETFPRLLLQSLS